MGFFDHAWKAAAEQYGADRSEKYGKIARFWAGLQVVAIILFVAAIAYMIGKHGGQ